MNIKIITVFVVISLKSILGQIQPFGLENQKVTSLALTSKITTYETIIAGSESN